MSKQSKSENTEMYSLACCPLDKAMLQLSNVYALLHDAILILQEYAGSLAIMNDGENDGEFSIVYPSFPTLDLDEIAKKFIAKE